MIYYAFSTNHVCEEKNEGKYQSERSKLKERQKVYYAFPSNLFKADNGLCQLALNLKIDPFIREQTNPGSGDPVLLFPDPGYKIFFFKMDSGEEEVL